MEALLSHYKDLSPTELLAQVFIIDVFIRGVIIYTIAKIARAAFSALLLRGKREVAIWAHYRNKAHDKGHTHRTPFECADGDCSII